MRMTTEEDRELFAALQQADQGIAAVVEIATRGMDPALAGIYGNRVSALWRALMDELKGGPTREIIAKAAEGPRKPGAIN